MATVLDRSALKFVVRKINGRLFRSIESILLKRFSEININ